MRARDTLLNTTARNLPALTSRRMVSGWTFSRSAAWGVVSIIGILGLSVSHYPKHNSRKSQPKARDYTQALQAMVCSKPLFKTVKPLRTWPVAC